MAASVGNAHFVMRFDKFRARGDETTADMTWRLTETGWDVSEPDLCDAHNDPVVAAVWSLKYINQSEIAEALGLSNGTVSKRLKRADLQGALSRQQRAECFEKALELRHYDPSLDDPMEGEEDF